MRTIAISRPFGQGPDTAETVRKLGWTPLIFHTVELKPLDPSRIREQTESVLSQGTVDWIVFMSSTGVKLFFDNITPLDRQIITAPNGTHFLAVGPRTRELLVHYGIMEAEVPDSYSSAGVGEWFSRMTPEHIRIVLVRSSSAEDSLARSLEYRGATVTTISLYESALPDDTESVFYLLSRLETGEVDAVLFTSAVSVSNFFKIAETRFETSHLTRLLKNTVVGAIGPVTARRLWDRDVATVVPDEYLIEKAITKLIEKTLKATSAGRPVA
jgi:uroporphyrinogen-III synthase